MRSFKSSLLVVACLLSALPAHSMEDYQAEHIQGLADYKAGKYKTAVSRFEASRTKGNVKAENYIYLAHSYAALGNLKEAVRIYREVETSFKGTPAAALAAQCIRRFDPKGAAATGATASGATSTAASAAGSPAAGATASATTRRAPSRGAGLMSRIYVLPPTVQGHPPVNANTVSIVRTAVSRLPGWIYTALDAGGVTINIGPNISDKWPERAHQSKPGMEQITLGFDNGITQGRDIYIWERRLEMGGKELGRPIDAEDLSETLVVQLGHALNDCLGWSKEEEFKKQYDLDKGCLNKEKKHEYELYAQDNGAGSAEVIAAFVGANLGGEVSDDFEKNFVRCKDWVKNRLEQERNRRSGVASRMSGKSNSAQGGSSAGVQPGSKTGTQTASNSKPSPAVATYLGGTASGVNAAKSKSSTSVVTAAAATTPAASTSPKEATLSMPAEERIPYVRHASGHLYVRGEINGKHAPIMIDTGAYKVVIGKEDLLALGIKPPEGKTEYIGSGAAGALKGWEMDLDISIGRIKRRMPVQVLDGKEVMLLGQPFFKGMHYQIDNASNYIRFTRDNKTFQRDIAMDSIEVPFRMVNGNLMVPVKVNGQIVEMNFDTGAPHCLFSQMSMYMLDLEPEARTRLGGVGGSTTDGYVCKADSMELGPIRKHNMEVLVSPAVGHDVLGQSFFGNMKYVVDNDKHVIRFSR